MTNWTPFTERMPPPRSGYLLVTNNIEARDAFGKSSHIWLVSMVHTHDAEPSWMPLRNLTHWRFALPEEAL